MVQQAKEIPSRNFAEVKDEAVAAALAGKWKEAAELNREAVAISPDDTGSHNRLAAALIELGRYGEAREAAAKALELSPGNRIAQKHLDRLSQLNGHVASAAVTSGTRAAARFITDSAKATVTELIRPAETRVLATVSPGQVLQVKDTGSRMDLSTKAGERIGTLEVHIAQRLRRLLAGGNTYEFTVAKLSATGIAVLVAETHCAPGMSGVVSFPPALQKTAKDIDLDDEPLEEGDDGLEVIETDDEETITPEYERTERLKSLVSGRLGGAYDIEDEGLSI
jgi:tetratricopeptide (TPR) repeat protein